MRTIALPAHTKSVRAIQHQDIFIFRRKAKNSVFPNRVHSGTIANLSMRLHPLGLLTAESLQCRPDAAQTAERFLPTVSDKPVFFKR